MPGTTPGGMTPGTAGAGVTRSGTAAGHGMIPGTTGTGAATAIGALTTDLTIMAGAIIATTITGEVLAAASPGTEVADTTTSPTGATATATAAALQRATTTTAMCSPTTLLPSAEA